MEVNNADSASTIGGSTEHQESGSGCAKKADDRAPAETDANRTREAGGEGCAPNARALTRQPIPFRSRASAAARKE
jgi:hypothetical protein